MSVTSRRKGKRGEADFAIDLDRRELRYLREQDGRTQGADFLIDGVVAVEVRRRRRMLVATWHHQLREKITSADVMPWLDVRADREPPLVVMLRSDALDLLEEAGR